MISDYLIYVTMSTNICNNSKTVSDESTLAETRQVILLVIYCISSLILFVQLKMSLRERRRLPDQGRKPKFSANILVEETLLNTPEETYSDETLVVGIGSIQPLHETSFVLDNKISHSHKPAKNNRHNFNNVDEEKATKLTFCLYCG